MGVKYKREKEEEEDLVRCFFFSIFFFRELSDLNVIYKSETLFNIYSFLNENIKSSNTKDKVKTTRTVKKKTTTTIDLISQKNNFARAAHFFFLISKKKNNFARAVHFPN